MESNKVTLSAQIDPIDYVEDLIESGDPGVWEISVEVGKGAAHDADHGRYTLGDLALMLGKEYGADRLGEFAREVNVPAKRLAEYRQVSGYYEKSARAEILSSMPNLSYTHLRSAMRFKNLDRSLEFLRAASDGDYTCERAEFEAKKLTTGDPDSITETLFSARCIVGAFSLPKGNDPAILLLHPVDPASLMDKLKLKHVGAEVSVRITITVEASAEQAEGAK